MRDNETPAWSEEDWAGVRVRVGLSPEPPQLQTYPWI